MSKTDCYAIIIIFIAFLIRLLYVINTPLTGDEKEFMAVADTISFNINQMNLPVEHDLINHPLLSVYLLKLGAAIFPESKLGTRIVSLASSLGTFIILYIFCRLTLGEKHAIVALLLLGLNRFHIGVSGNGADNALLLFLSAFSIFLFWKALTKQKPFYFIASGVALGLAYLTNESAVVLLGCFMIYFLCDNAYGWKKLVQNKNVHLLLLSFFCVILIDIIWILKHGPAQRLLCGRIFSNLGIGVSGVGFFVTGLLRYIRNIDYYSLVSWEYPAMTWYEGLLLFLCSMGIVARRGLKTSALKIMGITFLLFLLATSIFKNAEFKWAEVSLIPAIYLSSSVIVRGMEKNALIKPVFYIFVSFSLLSACMLSFNAKYVMPPNRFANRVDYDMDLMKWYFAQRRIDKAIEEARDALGICPNEARIHNLLGIFYAAKGEMSVAESEFIKAVALKPDFMYAKVNLDLLQSRCVSCIDSFLKTYSDY